MIGQLRKGIVVLGMHRSGTSAFTGTLNHLGVAVGSDLLKPSDSNPKGHFENKKVIRLNENLLNELHSSWDDPLIREEFWWRQESLEKYHPQIKQLLTTEFMNNQMFVIKEPRLCRLLPLWQEVFSQLELAVYYVIPIRHPMEVAISLAKRNGMSMEKALVLWVNHLLEAELYSRNYPRLFISYDQLLNNVEMVLARISRLLGINFPMLDQERLNSIHRFLEPDLKHNSFEGKLKTIGFERMVALLYEIFKEATVAGILEPYRHEGLDRIREEYREWSRYLYHKEQIYVKDEYLRQFKLVEYEPVPKETYIRKASACLEHQAQELSSLRHPKPLSNIVWLLLSRRSVKSKRRKGTCG